MKSEELRLLNFRKFKPIRQRKEEMIKNRFA